MEIIHLDQGRREVLNALMNVIHFQHTKEVVTVNSVIITNFLDFRQLKRKKCNRSIKGCPACYKPICKE